MEPRELLRWDDVFVKGLIPGPVDPLRVRVLLFAASAGRRKRDEHGGACT